MKVVLLPGDGIGPELTAAARRVLDELAPDLEIEEHLFGAAAIRATGTPLPDETLAACLAAGAILKGPIGDPEFDAAEVRPEQGLLRLRAELGVYANLRPARADGVDLVIVRELVGGLYYGARGVREDGTVFDTCEYHPSQVERIARRGFDLARSRRAKLTSVDKANVLETSRMWRRVVRELAGSYPDVTVEDMLVDNAAMQLASGAGAVRRDRHGEHVRRHPLRPRRSGHGRPRPGTVREPVRRGPGPLRAGARLGAGHRRPRHGQSGSDAPLGGAAARASRGAADEAATLEAAIDHALVAAPTPDLGGSATSA